MKVLITGATGFIGKHLCKLLNNQGHEIIALVRPGSDIFEISQLSNITFVFGDILHFKKLDTLDSFPEVVFHLAADWSRLDIEDDKSFVDYLISKKAKKLIFYSSVCASGLDLSSQPLNELDKPKFLPTDYYGKYKYDVEQYINTKMQEGSICGINLRPTIVYGPNDLSNLFPLFQAIRNGNLSLWDNGSQLLRLCFVDNLNLVACKLAFSEVVNDFNTFHVGDEELLTLREVCQIIADKMGRNFHYKNHSSKIGRRMGFLRFVTNRFGFTNSFATHFAFNKWTREYNADIQLLEKSLVLNFLIPFNDAIEGTMEWYKMNNQV
jgi:nucleoside-diphosphate-sugar epimerase